MLQHISQHTLKAITKIGKAVNAIDETMEVHRMSTETFKYLGARCSMLLLYVKEVLSI